MGVCLVLVMLCILFWVKYAISSFAIISQGKRELVAFNRLLMSYLIVSFLCLCLTVPCVGQQCVIVAFSGHTHLPFHVLLLS